VVGKIVYPSFPLFPFPEMRPPESTGGQLVQDLAGGGRPHRTSGSARRCAGEALRLLVPRSTRGRGGCSTLRRPATQGRHESAPPSIAQSRPMAAGPTGSLLGPDGVGGLRAARLCAARLRARCANAYT
jgi:hypothetical protein